jgi:oxysterol-binding protein-related protein 9/10/11
MLILLHFHVLMRTWQFLSSVQGDLSNITAPPFFLAPTSVVEAGNCWAERPSLFTAPAREPDAQKRSLLVLQHVLAAMRSQLYIGGSPSQSIKKPLNAFLGEVFRASWTDPETGDQIKLVSEQVSHHPPITAMHIRDEKNGIRADGYARTEMTFGASGADIKQIGHAVLSIDNDEIEDEYLIPLPDVKVRGFLGGRLYPEVNGTKYIISSSGYVAEMKFSGAGLCWGKKNSFVARIYQREDPSETNIYTVEGVWSEGWTIKNAAGQVIERYELDAPENGPVEEEVAPLKEQDPFESRRAWAGVREALERSDFRSTVTEKTKIEQAQRKMRAKELQISDEWKPLLFRSSKGSDHDVFHQLTEGFDWKLNSEKTKGVWRVDDDKLAELQTPFRPGVTPLGY